MQSDYCKCTGDAHVCAVGGNGVLLADAATLHCRFWTVPHMLVVLYQPASLARPMPCSPSRPSASSQLRKQLPPQLLHLNCIHRANPPGPMHPLVASNCPSRYLSRQPSSQDQQAVTRAHRALHTCQLYHRVSPPPLSAALHPMGALLGGVLTCEALSTSPRLCKQQGELGRALSMRWCVAP